MCIRDRTRPDARRRYHEVELDRWRKRLNMPLVLRPRFYPTDNQFSARMVIAADKLGWEGAKLLAMQDTWYIMAAWQASETEAARHGVLGTPTYVYKDTLYWGQD